MSLIDEMTQEDWSRFDEAVVEDGECRLWRPWQSKKTGTKFRLNGRDLNARRVAFEGAGGSYKDGRYVRMTCRQVRCVNPDHMTARSAPSGGLSVDEEMARFFAQVDKTKTPPPHAAHLGNCWQWTSRLNDAGYGQFKLHGRTRSCHRALIELLGVKGVDDLLADHMCHNRGCVSPRHIRFVDHKANAQNLGPDGTSCESGFRGVHRNRDSGWKATVQVDGKVHYLGHFRTPEEAHAVASQFRRDNMPNSLVDQLQKEAA